MVIDELVTILGISVDAKAVAAAKSFLGTVDSVAQKVKAYSLAMTAAATGVLYFVEKANEGAAAIYRFGQRTGIATDALQELQYATEQAGGDAGSLMQDLEGLAQSMSSPIPGEYNEALFMLGVNVRNAKGELKSADQVLGDIADKMQGKSATEQAQWANRIGISGDTLLLLKKGRGEIERFRAEARNIPTVVSEKQLRGAQDFVTSLTTLRRMLTYVGQEVSSAVGPALRDMVTGFSEWLKVNREWIQLGLGKIVEGVTDGFSRFGELLGRVWNKVKEVFPGLEGLFDKLMKTDIGSGLIYAGLAVLLALLALVLVSVGLTTAAFVAAGLAFEDFLTYLEGGDSVFGDIVAWLGQMWEKVTGLGEKFPVFRDALKELGDAFRGLWESLKELPEGFLIPALEKIWELLQGIGGAIAWVLDKFSQQTEAAKADTSWEDRQADLMTGGVTEYGGSGSEDVVGDTVAALRSAVQQIQPAVQTAAQAAVVGATEARKMYGQFEEYARQPVATAPAAAQAGRAEGAVATQAPNQLTITNHIQGQGATGIAAETSRRLEHSLRYAFPGGLAPVAQ